MPITVSLIPPPPVFTREIENPAICLVMKKVVPFQWTNLPSAFMLLNETDLPVRQCVLSLWERESEREESGRRESYGGTYAYV